MKEVLRPVKLLRPSLQVIDFADDLRLVEASGSSDRLLVSMARMMELLTRIGVHFHTREGKCWWPAKSIPWIGFTANAEGGVVEIEPKARESYGPARRCCYAAVQISYACSAFLFPASYLNFLQWIAPGGFPRPRSGWNIVNACGVMGRSRAGARGADCPGEVSDEFRNDTCWWWRASESNPVKRIRHSPSGSFAWHPQLPGLRDKALSVGRDSARSIYTDASGSRKWGATPGERLLRGQRKLERIAGAGGAPSCVGRAGPGRAGLGA